MKSRPWGSLKQRAAARSPECQAGLKSGKPAPRPRTSWWATAPRDGFTARAARETEETRGIAITVTTKTDAFEGL